MTEMNDTFAVVQCPTYTTVGSSVFLIVCFLFDLRPASLINVKNLAFNHTVFSSCSK